MDDEISILIGSAGFFFLISFVTIMKITCSNASSSDSSCCGDTEKNCCGSSSCSCCKSEDNCCGSPCCEEKDPPSKIEDEREKYKVRHSTMFSEKKIVDSATESRSISEKRSEDSEILVKPLSLS